MTCHDCERDLKIHSCEIHNPKLAKICKNCCITKFNGHRCKWFELCWMQ